MDPIIKTVLEKVKREIKVYNLIEQIENFLISKKDGDVDVFDVILDHYNIPPDNIPSEDEDDAKITEDLFCRDFFYDRIFDTLAERTTFDELDYILENWDKIFSELEELFPDGIPGEVELSEVMSELIVNLRN